ncbi:MAG: M48 family metallopeptidase, partial [Spirochaetes bacterium]|nr:M48 family metallopeptidase [Spirochaetota bacterium]
WYKEQAYKKIRERLDRYSVVSDIQFKKFTISNAQKRWGSCSSRGNLHFSWRLIMAALRVVDYVVVHELVHIREQNHSAKFWKKVELLLPDYRSNRQWLKLNGYSLDI